MTEFVFYVKSNTSMHVAMEMLVKHNISGIPVVDDNINVVGIISEEDILKNYAAELSDLINKPVSDLMTQPAIFFEENESLLEVCQCLANNDFRQVPITSSGTLIGIISRRDIIKRMLKAAQAHTKSEKKLTI